MDLETRPIPTAASATPPAKIGAAPAVVASGNGTGSGAAPPDYVLEVHDLRTHFHLMEGVVKAVDGASFGVRRGTTLAIVGESGCGKSVTARSILRLVEPPGKIAGGRILYRPGGRNGAHGAHGDAGETIDLTALPARSPRLRAIRGREIAMVFQEPVAALSPAYPIGEQIAEALRAHQGEWEDEVRRRVVALLRQVGLPDPAETARAYPHQLSGGMAQRAMIALALSCAPRLLIADEPTTALDVTTQAQILDLLRRLQAARGLTVILITHDLGVVAEMADDVAVMYLGKVVERGTAHELFTDPKHPYTRALLRSVPPLGGWEGGLGGRRAQHLGGWEGGLGGRRAQQGGGVDGWGGRRAQHMGARTGRLHTISGSVPDPYDRPTGCAFHPRCAVAVPGVCDTHTPRAVDLSGGREVRCVLFDGGELPAAPLAASLAAPGGGPDGDASHHVPPAAPAARPRGAVPLLAVRDLTKHYPAARGRDGAIVRAVDGVSFDIAAGETFALVGESGCGKSTTGRSLLRATDPTSGEVHFQTRAGRRVDLARLSANELRALRPELQMIFQDPFTSLNPRMTVLELVGEPLRVNRLASGAELDERAAQLVERVGLRRDHLRRYPHAFSGGERQRIAIARALSVDPRLVVADEAVSALDVSVRAQILNLLQDLQTERSLSYLFISHDLSVVEHISDRVAVMYLGRIVEVAETQALYAEPKHPYTEALLSAIPFVDPGRRRERIILDGEVPNAAHPPPGCHFHTRCRYAEARCRAEAPALTTIAPGHLVACHYAERLRLRGAGDAGARTPLVPPVANDAAAGTAPRPEVPTAPRPVSPPAAGVPAAPRAFGALGARGLMLALYALWAVNGALALQTALLAQALLFRLGLRLGWPAWQRTAVDKAALILGVALWLAWTVYAEDVHHRAARRDRRTLVRAVGRAMAVVLLAQALVRLLLWALP